MTSLLATSIGSELQLIPESAWIQAVFVCLFIIFVVAVFNWTAKREEKMQQWQSEQSKEWRDAILQRDRDWQRWWETQNERSNECMNNVTKVLGGVSDNQVRMMRMLEDHDNNLEPRVERLIENAQQNGKKRRSTGSV